MKIRNIMKKVCCMVLAVVLTMSATLPVAGASAKYDAAVSRYKKFVRLNDGPYKWVDLDGNGIPELIIHNTSMQRNELYTYNYTQRRMIPLKRIGFGKLYNKSGIKYNKGKKQVMIATGNTGGATSWIYKVQGKKVKKIATFAYHNGRGGTRFGYQVNGKWVSEKNCSKKYKTAIKGFRTI